MILASYSAFDFGTENLVVFNLSEQGDMASDIYQQHKKGCLRNENSVLAQLMRTTIKSFASTNLPSFSASSPK